jgi:S-formylglutathione hydrolase FrmB
MNPTRPALPAVAVAVAVAACGATPSPTPATPTVAAVPAPQATSDGRTRIRGTISLAQTLAGYAPHGQLAVGWLTPEEKSALEQGHPLSMRSAKELGTGRLVAVGEADFLTLATQVPYEIEVPADGAAASGQAGHGEGVVPFALVDVCGNVFAALFGGCEGSVLGFGADTHPQAGQTVTQDVVLTQRRSGHARPEACQGERRELLRVVAPKTAGAVGNETRRRACVYLPESYARHPARHYPVIYALPGLGGDDGSFLRHDVDLDALQKAAGREVIVVSVDTSTKHGSSYLVDSPLEGDFDAFLSSVLPATIDRTYRTLAKPKDHGRALVGQSTGGFNAISLALRHSDLFSAVAAMSPDGLDLAAWLAPDGTTMAAPWLHLLRLEDGMKSQGEMTSLAASFSPDASKPRGFAWPCDLASGKLDETVWSKWLAHSPSALITQPAILEAVRVNLGPGAGAHTQGPAPSRVYVTVAQHDEFDLFEPDKRFVDQLVAAGVPATFVPTDGGHTDGVEARQRASIEALLKVLDPAKP